MRSDAISGSSTAVAIAASTGIAYLERSLRPDLLRSAQLAVAPPWKKALWLKAVRLLSQVGLRFQLDDRKLASSGSSHTGNTIHGVAALSALLVGANLADALEDLDLDPLLGQAGEEAADRVWCPACRFSNLWSAGTSYGAAWPGPGFASCSLSARGVSVGADPEEEAVANGTQTVKRSDGGINSVSLLASSSHASSRACAA